MPSSTRQGRSETRCGGASAPCPPAGGDPAPRGCGWPPGCVTGTDHTTPSPLPTRDWQCASQHLVHCQRSTAATVCGSPAGPSPFSRRRSDGRSPCVSQVVVQGVPRLAAADPNHIVNYEVAAAPGGDGHVVQGRQNAHSAPPHAPSCPAGRAHSVSGADQRAHRPRRRSRSRVRLSSRAAFRAVTRHRRRGPVRSALTGGP